MPVGHSGQAPLANGAGDRSGGIWAMVVPSVVDQDRQSIGGQGVSEGGAKAVPGTRDNGTPLDGRHTLGLAKWVWK